MLDPVECEQARVSRNRAYDGRFLTGVRMTGVYYRPVCPARLARGCNVEFFPSAAAAEVAGYRRCLRCRPETAPFSPARRGSRTTVDRAMRLIHKGAIDEGSVQNLATWLGVGVRHLSRLFQKQVGARPIEVAKTVACNGLSGSLTRRTCRCLKLHFAPASAASDDLMLYSLKSTSDNRARSGGVSERRRPAGSKPKRFTVWFDESRIGPCILFRLW
jgi:AraC family transcriptional regulator of adaptative response/methylated-DNA-[protein]-cysteine methyltransferase